MYKSARFKGVIIMKKYKLVIAETKEQKDILKDYPGMQSVNFEISSIDKILVLRINTDITTDEYQAMADMFRKRPVPPFELVFIVRKEIECLKLEEINE